MKDICCIGHVTKDKIVTPHRTVYMAGGTSFYFAYAINQLPKDVSFSLVTAMDPTETEPIEIIHGQIGWRNVTRETPCSVIIIITISPMASGIT